MRSVARRRRRDHISEGDTWPRVIISHDSSSGMTGHATGKTGDSLLSLSDGRAISRRKLWTVRAFVLLFFGAWARVVLVWPDQQLWWIVFPVGFGALTYAGLLRLLSAPSGVQRTGEDGRIVGKRLILLSDERAISKARLWGARLVSVAAVVSSLTQPTAETFGVPYLAGLVIGACGLYWLLLRVLATPLD